MSPECSHFTDRETETDRASGLSKITCEESRVCRGDRSRIPAEDSRRDETSVSHLGGVGVCGGCVHACKSSSSLACMPVCTSKSCEELFFFLPVTTQFSA